MVQPLVTVALHFDLYCLDLDVYLGDAVISRFNHLLQLVRCDKLFYFEDDEPQVSDVLLFAMMQHTLL